MYNTVKKRFQEQDCVRYEHKGPVGCPATHRSIIIFRSSLARRSTSKLSRQVLCLRRVVWRHNYVVTPILIAEAIDGTRLVVAPVTRWINAIFTLETTPKYVCTQHELSCIYYNYIYVIHYSNAHVDLRTPQVYLFRVDTVGYRR